MSASEASNPGALLEVNGNIKLTANSGGGVIFLTAPCRRRHLPVRMEEFTRLGRA